MTPGLEPKPAARFIETRTIHKITDLFDVSAVSLPANPNTTITA